MQHFRTLLTGDSMKKLKQYLRSVLDVSKLIYEITKVVCKGILVVSMTFNVSGSEVSPKQVESGIKLLARKG
jgi:hypothetical protein